MFRTTARPTAIATVRGGSDAPNLFGTVRFYQKREGVLVVAHVMHLPPSGNGFFAFHIHEGASCTGENFADTGSHYNPEKLPHPRHVGDLPPLLSYGGRAYLAVMTDRFRVRDILGRSVVSHSGADDFVTQPAGNAGQKIACGIIYRS